MQAYQAAKAAVPDVIEGILGIDYRLGIGQQYDFRKPAVCRSFAHRMQIFLVLETGVAALHTHVDPARGYAKAIAVDHLRITCVEVVTNLFDFPALDQYVFHLTIEGRFLINYPNRAN